MINRLNQLKSVLDGSGTLSKDDKEFIKSEYKKVQGTELITKSKCKNCWKDAIIILIHSLSGKKIRMRAGSVYVFNNMIYNPHNITDGVAMQIMAANPETKINFY
ncbi:MAG: hypothetical protein ACOYOV_14315 [Bacteroidales bacterium]